MKDALEKPDTSGIVQGRHHPVKREESVRMRREMTPAEALLWGRLRAGRLGGLHFRRQQLIGGLIVDFYCHQAALVVECDGPIHETQREHDEDWDAILSQRGLRILRFPNHQVERAMQSVLQTILAASEMPQYTE